MYYDKDERAEDGSKVIDDTTLMRYRMSDGYQGLCSVGGCFLLWHYGSRMHFDAMRARFADDAEMNDVFDSYKQNMTT